MNIAVWGPTSAGKTVLLARLYSVMEREQDQWKVMPSEASAEFIGGINKFIDEKNRFPPPTDVQSGETEVVYEFVGPEGARHIVRLEDRAGDHYEKMDAALVAQLAAADALVLMFDATDSPAHLRRHVDHALTKLYLARNDGKADSRPVAICLSKSDEIINSVVDLEHARTHPNLFVENYIRGREPDLLRLVEKFCSRVRYFPVSAVGISVSAGEPESAVFYDERLNARLLPDAMPLNLAAPFTWLFGELA